MITLEEKAMRLLSTLLALLALGVSLVVFHLSRETDRLARAALADSTAHHQQAEDLYARATLQLEQVAVLWRLLREGCAEETHP